MTTDATLNQIITDWTNTGRAFTAYEVSLEAKKQGLQERHANLRDEIHQLMDAALSFGNYRRTNVSVGSGLTAMLFHPDTYDVNQYQPLDRSALDRKSSTTPVFNPAPASTSPVTTPTTSGYALDFRNRLMVRKTFLEGIGANFGDTVGVFVEAGKASIRSFDPLQDTPHTTLKVERDGEVRVSQSTLMAAGFTGSNFNIQLTNSQIEITE